MTKPLTKSEKRKNREERRKAAKPAAVRVTGINEEKIKPPEPAAAAPPVNLCDTCAYEFGACEGVPKFAGEGDDRVVECPTWVDVASLPTADQGAKEPASQAEEPAQDEPELVAAEPIPGATEEGKKADVAVMTADLEERRKKIQRFQREEDLEKCPACQRPLKRTAFNRDRDAVRCTNPRCRQYRAVVRQIKAE